MNNEDHLARGTSAAAACDWLFDKRQECSKLVRNRSFRKITHRRWIPLSRLFGEWRSNFLHKAQFDQNIDFGIWFFIR